MRDSRVRRNLLLLAGLLGMAVFLFARMELFSANELFEEAKVTTGQFQPGVLYNCQRIYLYLLHGALFLLGNKVAAGAVLQVALQLGTAFFFCFTVNRLSGFPAAVFVLVTSCFSPYLLARSVLFSPLWFFLFCFGGTLWLFTGVLDSQGQKKDFRLLVRCLTAGSLIGFCCYLDPAGVVLFVFLAGVFWMQESGREKLSIVLGCTLAAFILYFGLYAIQAENMAALRAGLLSQWKLFVPGRLCIPFADGTAEMTWDFALILFCAVAGFYCFFYHRRIRGRILWLIAAGILLGMQALGMRSDQTLNRYPLLYLFFAAMAGCCLSDYFYFKECKMENENREVKPEGAEAENPKPRYIENPLPLPKKSVKKALDYDFEVSDDDDFDLH